MGAPKFGDLDWEAIRAERNAAKDEDDEDEDEEEEEEEVCVFLLDVLLYF